MTTSSIINTHLLINKTTYTGTIKPENVFEAICGAFIESPKSCLFLNNSYSIFMKFSTYKRHSMGYKVMIYWINFLILILLLSLAGLSFYMIYDKIYTRFLGENLKRIVSDSMSNYESIKNNE